MAKVEILVVNLTPDDFQVFFDEKVVFGKRVERGYLYTYETDVPKVTFMLSKQSRLYHPRWWLLEILFFLISLFGLLTIGRKDKTPQLLYQAEIDLSIDRQYLMYFTRAHARAIQVEVPTGLEEKVNLTYVDPLITKRQKQIKWIKFGIISAIFVIAVILIIVR